jgi:hypothetical protein
MTTRTVFGTAGWATRLLGVCSVTWIVAGLIADQAIAWRAIAMLWVVGWPMLFLGFTVHAFLDPASSELADSSADDPQAADTPPFAAPR